MNGSLTEGALPSLLRVLYVGRRTGLLHLSRDQLRHSVLFRRGDIVSARTDVTAERLGETLVRLGFLSEADFARATEQMVRGGRRLGQVLQELGILEKDRLEEALALHVREILLSTLAWNEGSYSFEEHDPDAPLEGDITLKVSTGELILEAVRRIDDPDIVRFALGNLDRLLLLSTDPLLRFQKITLTPTDGYILSRIDGTFSARELFQLLPVDISEAQKSLYGLLCTGVVEFLPEVPSRRRESARAATLPPVVADAPRVERIQPTSAGAAPPPDSEAIRARRREVLDAHEGLSKRNHFEVLGVSRNATEAQIKEAYFGLAKRFHPDVHHESRLSDLREKLEAVFIRLGQAYDVLKNPKSRAQYEDQLGRLTSQPEPASPAEPSPDPAYLARMALEALKKAETHLGQAEYWDAIQLLEPALPNLSGKQKQRARVVLARALMKNPHWIKRAEEVLESVIQEDPKYATAHFELATLYKDHGLKSRAIGHLRRVLELRPDHEEALAALQALAPEPQEPPQEGGGILRKLFGKH